MERETFFLKSMDIEASSGIRIGFVS
jgi:hypothetical protein